MCLTMFLIFGSPSSLSAQDKVNFKAFGYMPNLVNDSLYASLYGATSQEEQLPILYAIGQEHSTYGNTDSVEYYGKRIQNIPQIYTKS